MDVEPKTTGSGGFGRSRPLILGHRGASISHRENTLPAFAAAREAGADGVELDVRRTADDVLVVHHDAHLADGRLLREVAAADLPAELPTLAEALMDAGGSFVNIEIKNSPAEADYDQHMGISVAVAGLVASLDAHDQTLVSAFEMDSILRLREAAAGIPIGWLTWGGSDPRSLIDRAAQHELQSINPHDQQVDAAFVERAHASGLRVFVWTVDSPTRALELRSFGVDAIITNDPSTLLRAFARATGT